VKLINRIKFLPGAIRQGLDMGVSKRGIVKGCFRFLFMGRFRKPNKLFAKRMTT